MRRTTPRHQPTPPQERDLGFGAVVASLSRKRLLNADGSFNFSRRGLGFVASLSVYHALLRMGWPLFMFTLAAGYLVVNALFAAAYVACGPAALTGPQGSAPSFLRAFFFSIQTFATIGFGQIAPASMAANLLVVLESLVGVLGFAVATGLLFARISRPTARVVFSSRAVVAPFQGGRAFMLRIANGRRSELIELEAKVVLSLLEDTGGRRVRRFHMLPLERQRVAFFPLSWTIVHPIGEDSPLWALGPDELSAREAEFLVLLTGIEETFSQTVHTRRSYTSEEVVWGARFRDIFNRELEEGDLTIDLGRLHAIEPASLP